MMACHTSNHIVHIRPYAYGQGKLICSLSSNLQLRTGVMNLLEVPMFPYQSKLANKLLYGIFCSKVASNTTASNFICPIFD